jgi:hypothetical protein
MRNSFFLELFEFLDEKEIVYSFENKIIRLKNYEFSFYLVLESDLNSYESFFNYRAKELSLNGNYLLFIWFDLWVNKQGIIISKLTHLLNLSQKIHARKTKTISVTKADCETFFNQYHLNKPVIGYKRIGLMYNDELVALGSFAKRRRFRDNSYSAELLQFATKNKHHVNGGLSKIVSHFTKIHEIDSLMTYIDLDWSTGEKFKKIGFLEDSIKKHTFFTLNPITKNRDVSTVNTDIFNTGSLKNILILKKYP